MAVPDSGSLNMSKLAKEKLYDDYNSSSSVTGPIFMSDLVTGGNSSGSGESYDVTNTDSSSFPNNLTPHQFSEWRGYDHDATVGPAFGYYEMFKRESFQLYTGREPEYLSIASPDPYVVTNQPFGGPTRWRYFDIDLQNPLANAQFPGGSLIRPQMLFANLDGADLRNDVCISGDFVFLNSSGQVIDIEPFEPTGEYYPRYYGWTIRPDKIPSDVGQRSTSISGSPTDPNSVTSWADISYGTTTQTSNTWNYNVDETPSNGTGPEYNVFIEPFNQNFAIWEGGNIFDPQYSTPQTRNGYFYYEASGVYSTPSYQWFRWKTPKYVPQDARYLSFAYCAWSEDGPTTFFIDYLQLFLESVDPAEYPLIPPPVNF